MLKEISLRLIYLSRNYYYINKKNIRVSYKKIVFKNLNLIFNYIQ